MRGLLTACATWVGGWALFWVLLAPNATHFLAGVFVSGAALLPFLSLVAVLSAVEALHDRRRRHDN